MRETLELLEDLLGEARVEFDNGDFVEIEDDQARSILTNAGVTNLVTIDPKVMSYIEGLGYVNNARAAAQLYAKDPSEFKVGENQVQLPNFIALDKLFGQSLGLTCVAIAGLKKPEKGELGKGEVLFAMLSGGSMVEQAEGDTDVKVGDVEYSLKDFRGGPTKLGAKDTDNNLKSLRNALSLILEEVLKIFNINLSKEEISQQFGFFTSVTGEFASGTASEEISSGTFNFKLNLLQVMSRFRAVMGQATGLQASVPYDRTRMSRLPGFVQHTLDGLVTERLEKTPTVGLTKKGFILLQPSDLELSSLTQSRLKVYPKSIGTAPFYKATVESISDFEGQSGQDEEITPVRDIIGNIRDMEQTDPSRTRFLRTMSRDTLKLVARQMNLSFKSDTGKDALINLINDKVGSSVRSESSQRNGSLVSETLALLEDLLSP